MRKLPFGLFAVIATLGALQIATGCGSEDDPTIPPGDTDGGDGSPSGDGATSGDGGANTDGSSSLDSSPPVTETDASLNDAASCKSVGTTCGKSTECCTANCTAGKCANPIDPTCKLPGVSCKSPLECCTGSCVNGTCSNKQCVPDRPTAGACGQGGDCCSGICQGNLCRSANPTQTCRTAGNPCGGPSDCCSNLCNNGVCSDAVSFCTQQSEICASNADCCSGNCVKVGSNRTGTCGAPGGGGSGDCEASGVVCTNPSNSAFTCNCCSRSCGEYGSLNGFKVCQPPSGCRPTGEVCRSHSDCCGWAGGPEPKDGNNPNICRKTRETDEFGRCDNGGGCREPGSICKNTADGGAVSCAENNCCETIGTPSGNCNSKPEECCARDALGIPRCLVHYVGDCKTKPDAGTTCATSADCCGDPCVNGKCLGTCVQQGNRCTNNADCCSGLPCVVPTGSTSGICGGTLLPDGGVSDAGPPSPPDGGTVPDAGNCSLYGQTCTNNSDCCSGVPCTPPGGGGRCRYP